MVRDSLEDLKIKELLFKIEKQRRDLQGTLRTISRLQEENKDLKERLTKATEVLEPTKRSLEKLTSEYGKLLRKLKRKQNEQRTT